MAIKKKKRPSLQKMSDDITTTSFMPGLSEAKMSMQDLEKELNIIPPITSYSPMPPLPGHVIDFGPMLDVVGGIAFALYFVVIGYIIGSWK